MPFTRRRLLPAVALLALAVTAQRPDQFGSLATWIIGDDGARPLAADAPRAFPVAWTPDNRLIVQRYGSDNTSNAIISVARDGDDPVTVARGTIYPLGLAEGGATLVCVAGNATAVNAIVAIDLRTTMQRLVAEADALATRATILGPPPPRYIFAGGALAPDGRHLALVVAPGTAPGTPQPLGGGYGQRLMILSLDGTPTLTGIVALPDGTGPGPLSWSPGGTYLAYFSFGSLTSEYALKIVDTAGAARGSYPTYANNGPLGLTAAWSPDERWIAYTSPGGLTVVSPTSTHSYPLAPAGTLPT